MSSKPFSVDVNEALEPRVISIGTCRTLRIRQIGVVFFVENNQPQRKEDDSLEDHWKVVAVVKKDHTGRNPHTPWDEAHMWLADANEKVMALANEAMRRAGVTRRG